MKKTLTIVFLVAISVLSVLGAISNPDSSPSAELSSFLKKNKVKINYDEISETTWYKSQYQVRYGVDDMMVYLGQKGDEIWMRLRLKYHSKSWIFFDKAYIFVDDHKMDVPFNKVLEKDEYVSGGGYVVEYVDVLVDAHFLLLLEKIKDCDELRVGFSGRFNKTYKVSRPQQKGILSIINTYYFLVENNVDQPTVNNESFIDALHQLT